MKAPVQEIIAFAKEWDNMEQRITWEVLGFIDAFILEG